MKALLIRSSGAALILLFAACAKKPEAETTAKAAPSPAPAPAQAPLVGQSERSPHFEAVNSHLELGGTLYGYVDVDGDFLNVAKLLQSVAHQMAAVQPAMAPLEKKDFKEIFTILGLNDVQALGLSSVKEADDTYRNRTFFYMPAGRHGLFAALGSNPGKFEGVKLAPPDCDLYSEWEFDIGALYMAVRGVVEKTGGPEEVAALDKKMLEWSTQAGFSVVDLVKGLKGRATLIVRTDPHNTFATDGNKGDSIKFPATQVVIKVTGIGAAMENVLEKNASLISTTESTRHVFKPRTPATIEGFDFVFETEDDAFYFSTNQAFLSQCLAQKAGLDANPLFSEQLARLGPEGNGITWVSPRLFESIRSIPSLNPDVPPQKLQAFQLMAGNLPAITQPLFSIRTNLPDGILIRSNWYQSLKADIAMVTVYNPVTLGLVAAMAIPAFNKVRENSQAIAAANARAAAQARARARHSNPKNPSAPAASSNPSGSAANPDQPSAEVQMKGILDNLRILNDAANQYYEDHQATTTTFEQLTSDGHYVHDPITPVAGEDYRTVLFKKGRPLRLFLKDGRIVTYPPPQE